MTNTLNPEDIKVDDVVITDQLMRQVHLNNRLLRVNSIGEESLNATVLVGRTTDPLNLSGNPRHRVTANITKFHKI